MLQCGFEFTPNQIYKQKRNSKNSWNWLDFLNHYNRLLRKILHANKSKSKKINKSQKTENNSCLKLTKSLYLCWLKLYVLLSVLLFSVDCLFKQTWINVFIYIDEWSVSFQPCRHSDLNCEAHCWWYFVQSSYVIYNQCFADTFFL